MAVVDLASEVRSAAEKAPPLGPQALLHFQNIENGLQAFYDIQGTTLQHLYGGITEASWYGLDMLVAVLEQTIAQVLVEREQIDEMIGQVRELQDAVMAATDLSEAQKTILLEHLQQIERVILSVRITGVRPVRPALDGLLGSLWHLRDVAGGVVNHPITKMILTFVGAIAVILGLTNDIAALPASVQTYLELAQRIQD